MLLNKAMYIAAAVIAAVSAVGCDMQSAPQPKDAIDHYVAGQLLADQGEIDRALAELARAVETDPDLAVAYTAMGDIHRKDGNYEIASRFYQNACQANSYAFRPHYNLGVTYQALSRTAEYLDKAQEYLKKAVSTYLRAIAISPRDFDANLNISACYFELGKFDMAEQYCNTAIEINPQNPQAKSNLGMILDSQGRHYEAIDAYKSSLELNPQQPDILVNLGMTYVQLGRLKSAIGAFKTAARQQPENPQPWVQMGACRYRMGNYDEAEQAYRQAVELDKNNAVAHRGIGVVYMSKFVLEPKKTALRDKAIEAWHRSLEIDPDQDDLVRLVKKYTPKYQGPEL